MSTEFKDGYGKGFEEGGSGRDIDAFELSPHSGEYRVGYVLGFGESEFVSAPPDFRYHLIGEIAAKSGVGISLFERFHDLGDEDWEDFKKGYVGDEDEEVLDDEDDFDD
ncbi:hypothetical protein [Pseudomonas mandelii]|nr:hypothetical protein [Pseudomonas mandelii]